MIEAPKEPRTRLYDLESGLQRTWPKQGMTAKPVKPVKWPYALVLFVALWFALSFMNGWAHIEQIIPTTIIIGLLLVLRTMDQIESRRPKRLNPRDN